MHGERIARRGEPLEHLLAAFDHRVAFARRDGVEAQREEQMATWRDQPPLPVALSGSEVAGGFELRPGRPASILIAIRQHGLNLQLGLFFVTLARELRLSLQLSRPLGTRVLPEGVDNLFVSYAGREPNIIDHEPARPVRLK